MLEPFLDVQHKMQEVHMHLRTQVTSPLNNAVLLRVGQEIPQTLQTIKFRPILTPCTVGLEIRGVISEERGTYS